LEFLVERIALLGDGKRDGNVVVSSSVFGGGSRSCRGILGRLWPEVIHVFGRHDEDGI
jgi:hypothetical protein